MLAMGRAGLAAWRSLGVIIDFTDLEYHWGDRLDQVFSIGAGQYDYEDFPTALIVGPKCEEAVRMLLHDDVESDVPIDVFEWVHRDYPSARRYLEAVVRAED